jgi:hypothetical protein
VRQLAHEFLDCRIPFTRLDTERRWLLALDLDRDVAAPALKADQLRPVLCDGEPKFAGEEVLCGVE